MQLACFHPGRVEDLGTCSTDSHAGSAKGTATGQGVSRIGESKGQVPVLQLGGLLGP